VRIQHECRVPADARPADAADGTAALDPRRTLQLALGVIWLILML